MLIELLVAITVIPILTLLIEHLVIHAARRCRDAEQARRRDRQRRRPRSD